MVTDETAGTHARSNSRYYGWNGDDLLVKRHLSEEQLKRSVPHLRPWDSPVLIAVMVGAIVIQVAVPALCQVIIQD